MPVAERQPGITGQIKIVRIDELNNTIPYIYDSYEPVGMPSVREQVQNPFPDIIPILPPESNQYKPTQNLLLANRGVILGEQLRSAIDLDIPQITVLAWKGDRDTVPVKDALRLAETTGRVNVIFTDGKDPHTVYANAQKIIETAKIYRCDRFDPGWGFIAENHAELKKIEAGCATVGPTAKQVETWGNKASALLIAEKAGVKTLPWVDGANLTTLDEVINAAEMLGYPCLIKGNETGSGRGNRLARNKEELTNAWQLTHGHFEKNGGWHLTKLAQNVRHIEIPIIGDRYGNIAAIGDRNCSVQKNHQKGLEETTSFSAEEIEPFYEAAIRIATGYTGLGTVEFLVDQAGNIYFMEMNTRPQVEHPVSEAQTGIDQLGLQYRLAEGYKLDRSQIKRKHGHTMEVRLFFRQGGKIQDIGLYGNYDLPVNTRIDLANSTGSTVNRDVENGNFDGLGALLIVSGHNRENARQKMKQLLTSMKDKYQGPETNIEDMLIVLDDPRFIAGTITTAESEELFEQIEEMKRERNMLAFQKRLKRAWDPGREAA